MLSTCKLHTSACCPYNFSTRNEDTESEYFTAEEYIDDAGADDNDILTRGNDINDDDIDDDDHDHDVFGSEIDDKSNESDNQNSVTIVVNPDSSDEVDKVKA